MASEMMKAIKEYVVDIGNTGASFYDTGDFASMRAVVREASMAATPADGVSFEPYEANGVHCGIAHAEGELEGIAILYLHSGANITGSAEESRGFASTIADVTKCPVTSVSYRLSPENSFPAAPDDCINVYRALLEAHPGWQIAVVGDSAGGLMALDVALMARDYGLHMPMLLALYSPITEIAEDLPSRVTNAERDTVRHQINDDYKLFYCPGVDPMDPLISPLRADLTGFPEMQITVDESEVLFDDSRLLAEKAEKAGIPVHFSIFEGCFHAFPSLGMLTPESTGVMEELAALINARRAV